MNWHERQAKIASLSPKDRYRLLHYEGLVWPHHKLIAKACKRFNSDPAFQLKFHIISTYIFTLQIPIILAVSIFLPTFWSHAGVTYVAIISLFANAQTEYGAVPASEGALHAQAMHEGK